MTADLTFFCWTCYHPAPGSAEQCPHCGGPVHPGSDIDYTARLVWALHHPLADRRLLAARLLGQRSDRRWPIHRTRRSPTPSATFTRADASILRP